jgi:NAD(P)-dependent dehydrogenase (short-subunit alcohol dehydrogenase family)
MPGEVPGGPLVIGTPPARPIAEGLGAPFEQLPAVVLDPAWSQAHLIEAWRDEQRTARPEENLVVAVWPDGSTGSPLVDLDLGAWTAGMETPFALWFAALTAASDRCVDGGRVVAVTERPEGKRSAGWSLQSAVADAVEVMVRSLALVHRPRGVRLDVVSTSARLEGRSSVAADVVGALSMVLTGDSSGLDTMVLRTASEP